MPLQAGRPGDRPVVYDSDLGILCPVCGKPSKGCRCQRRPASVPTNQPPQQRQPDKADGILRVSRDRGHRRGKTVTIITGVSGGPGVIDELAGSLKRLCGSGGTVKDGVIEVQGDHREQVLAKLLVMGFKAKLAGG